MHTHVHIHTMTKNSSSTNANATQIIAWKASEPLDICVYSHNNSIISIYVHIVNVQRKMKYSYQMKWRFGVDNGNIPVSTVYLAFITSFRNKKISQKSNNYLYSLIL